MIKSAPKSSESEIFNNFYAYFWVYPFPCRDFDKSISPHDQWYSSDYKEDFESHFLRIKQICQDLPDKIFRNYIFIDYIEYFADAVLTLIKKIQYTYKISYICTEDLNAEKVTEIDKYLHVLRDMYEDLREKYEQLWLYSAKRPRLDNVLRYFDWMIYWLDSKHEEVEMGQQWKYPFILSDWIYAKEDEEDQTSEIRYFVKQFEMTQEKIDDLEEAWVQAIPSSYCEFISMEGCYLGSRMKELYNINGLASENQGDHLFINRVKHDCGQQQMLPKGIPTFNLFMEFTLNPVCRTL